MAFSLRCELLSLSAYPSCRGANATFQSGGRVEYPSGRSKGGEMYIGGGVLALIVIVLLLIWIL